MPWWKPDPPPEPRSPYSDRLLQALLQLPRLPPFSLLRATYYALKELEEEEPAVTAPVNVKIIEAFQEFYTYLPDAYWSEAKPEDFLAYIDAPKEPGATVSLYDILRKPGHAILDLAGPFCGSTMKSAGAFQALRRQLLTNEARASGFSYHERQTKKVIGPDEADAAPYDLVEMYLAHTPFFAFMTAQIPFTIPRQAFRAHGAIFAPSDHGKTQTLQNIICGFLDDPDPPALFIMDSMGAMLPKLRQLAVFEERLKGRLVVLDPMRTPAPQLNIFKLSGGSPAQQAELFFYLFKAIDQALTTRQKTTISFLMQLMQKIDGTLHDLRAVCESKQPLHMQAIQNLPDVVRDFFLNSFYKPDAFMTQTKAQIVARLYTLAADPVFDAMFSARDNEFNAYECIQQKKIVLINTNRFAIGDDASAIFGRFILAQCLSAALARAPIPEHERHLALLVVDEAKQYFDDHTEKILADARQFGLGLLFATQYVHQLQEGVRRAMYGNTAIKMIGPIEYGDRVSLSREMNTTPEFIGSMRAYDRSHAEWAVHIRTSNLTPRAVKVDVPYGTLENAPRRSAVGIDAAPTSVPTTTSDQPNLRADPQPVAPVQDAEPLIKPGKEWQ